MDEIIALARAGRVVADRIRHEPLPAGTDSISIPKVVTGTTVAEQAPNGTFSETDMTSGSATSLVTTEGGTQTVPIQLVEQSPLNIDTLVLGDLAAALAQAIDVFVLTNNAANKRGILNVTGINAITYTDASPTFPELWPKLVDASRQVGKNRLLPATEVWMHGDRWAWLQAQLDANGRPYISDTLATALPLLGLTEGGTVPQGLAGTIRGLNLPVFVDPNIPVNLGAGTNEDRIITARASDVVLYESTPRAEAFRETLAKNGQVVFRIYEYLALMSERAPKAVSVISGTGLVAPTF
jgi:HK97 family phage major capsid protein